MQGTPLTLESLSLEAQGIARNILDAMQVADELAGCLDYPGYINLMNFIRMEAQRRATAAAINWAQS